MGKKINFGDGHKDTKLIKGSYEDMIRERKEKLPEMQESVQQLFDNWDGQPLAIAMVKEDENGKPEGAYQLIVGAGQPASQLRLVKALDKAQDEIIKVLGKHTAELGGEDMIDMIKQVVEAIDNLKRK